MISHPSDRRWPPGDSEMVGLIRNHDWTGTSLGSIESWSDRLKGAVELILATPHVASVAVGPERLLLYNDAAARVYGGHHPGALGRPLTKTWPEAHVVAEPLYERAFAGEAVHCPAQPLDVSPAGGEVFDVTLLPVRGSDGSIIAVQMTGFEVGARTRAETALRESEERRRLAAEAARIGTWDFDLTTGTGQWDEAAVNIAGLPRTELGYDAESWLRLVHPDDRNWAGEAFQASLAPGGPRYDVEFRCSVPAPDGGPRWLSSRGAVLRDPATQAVRRAVGILQDVTQRRQREERLAAREAQLAASLAAGRMVAWSLDLGTGFIERSKNADTIFGPGTTPETFNARMPPEDAAADRERLEAALDGRAQHYGSEFRYRHPDGRLLWLQNWGQVVRDHAGHALRMHGVCLDLTERKEAEQALHDLKETLEARVAEALAERKLLADVFEGTDAMISVADRDLRLLAFNGRYADEVENLGGRRPRLGDLIPDLYAEKPELAAPVEANWRRAVAGEVFKVTEEHGDPTRYRHSYERRFEPIRDREGRLMGAYQYATDVTEQLRHQRRAVEAETARREADALYRAYFESTSDALFVIRVEQDGGFVVEQVNPAHEAQLGHRLAEIAGKRIEHVLPPDVAEPVLRAYRRVIETGEIQQYREAFDLPAGRQYWDNALVPVPGADGRIARIFGSSRNVTQQVLTEEAARQSQKMEAMGQLTGGVAHDFNNLLTPIIASLDMLIRRGIGSERERRLMDGALQSAERAKVLVQRLLAFARRQPLQPGPVDLKRLVGNMTDLIASTLGPRIDVRADLPDDLPPALADTNQLEMAVLNLAVNARDAMPDGGVLTISAERASVEESLPSKLRPGEYLLLSIKDTGIGMDEPTLARAVEPFFSTKGIGKGTGLGLSMVHGLTSQLGGGLAIASSPGQGTTVDLWLPLSVVSAGGGDQDHNAQDAGKAQGTALLVDDEDLVRMTTADMLMDIGYEVVEVVSAEEALHRIGGGLHPDLVVTDHLMPGMSGVELARELHASRPDLPVLIVSGYAEVDGIAPGLPRLTKPFRAAELASKIASLIDG